MADKQEEVSLTAGDPALKAASTVNIAAINEEVLLSLETASSNINLSGNEALPGIGKDKTKIDILLKATGNAPIMKKKKWAVSQDQHIGWISEFIKKYLKLDSGERLVNLYKAISYVVGNVVLHNLSYISSLQFLYINQTFAPAPDQTVKNLYDCYGTDGKLIIHYCKSQAWG